MNLIENWLTTNKKELIHIASDIFCHPETAYQETYSSKRLANFLETQGFRVTWKTAGIDTAFTAVWGSGQANAWISGRIRCTAGDRSRLRT